MAIKMNDTKKDNHTRKKIESIGYVFIISCAC